MSEDYHKHQIMLDEESKTTIEEAEETKERTLEDYLNDNILDEESKMGCCQRYFAPIASGSLRGSIMAIASICLGPASLSLPIAMTNMGLIPGTILFLTLSIIPYLSLLNFNEIGRKKKIMNYSNLIKACLGDTMVLVIDINNIIFCFGMLMSFQFTSNLFFMEVMHTFFETNLNNEELKLIQMSLCMILVQIPLSLMKNISKLQYASIVGSFALIYTVIVMLFESPFYYLEGKEEGRSIKYFEALNWNYLDSCSIFLYIFALHNGVFAVFSELKRPTLRRSTKVINRVMLLLFILFTISAYSGYFSLLKKTPSIFISRPPLKFFQGIDYFTIVSKILFFFSLQCFCAITYNIIRGSLKSVCFKGKDLTFRWELVTTISIFLASNALTYSVDNVVSIIGILGGLCAVLVCFVSPILCYVKGNDYPRYHWKNVLYVSILVIICIVGLMSTVKTIIDNVNRYIQ